MAKDIGETAGRQEGAGAAGTTESVGAAVSSGSEQGQAAAAGEMQADGGQPKQKTVEEIVEERVASLKGALEKERGSNKTSERERRRLAQQVDALTRQLQEVRTAVPQPKPDFNYQDPLETVDMRIAERISAREKAEQAALHNFGRALAMDRYEDFEDVEAAFLDAAAKNPALWNEVNPSGIVPLQVYKQGKKLLESAGAGSAANDRIAKLEAEIAALKAGRDGGQTAAATETAAATAQKPSVARSNVGARGTGVGTTTTYRGPTPSENVYGRQRARATRS